MEINKINYPSILIDYIDGNIDALGVAEVLLFLEQNPDIKNEFEGINKLVISAPNACLLPNEKVLLKKIVSDEVVNNSTFDELMVAQMEGDLSASSNQVLNSLITQNTSLQKLQNIFISTKITPNFAIQYEQKNKLKKRTLIIPLFRIIAVAASLLLLVGLSYFIYFHTTHQISNHNNNQVAETKTIIKNNIVLPVPIKKVVEVPKSEIKPTLVINKTTKNSINQTVVLNKNKSIKTNTNEAIAFQNNVIIKAIKPRALQVLTIENNAPLEVKITPLPITENVWVASNTAQEEYPTIFQLIKNKIIKKGAANLNEKNEPNGNFDALHVLSAGANIIDKTTGQKVLLKRNYNNNGSVKSFAISVGNFTFERLK
jgi:hypothetical protein